LQDYTARSKAGLVSRRRLLQSWGCGFGHLAVTGLSPASVVRPSNALAPRLSHFPGKAKRVILLFMQGGPSQYETFEYNPELAAAAQKSQGLMAPVYRFSQYGESGQYISELFPHLAGQADELCVLNGMYTDSPAHFEATVHLHTGSYKSVRPSLGAWVVHGLGSENPSLPAFVTINPAGMGGARNYGSVFLPADCQGTPCETRARRAEREADRIIEPCEPVFHMQGAAHGLLDWENETEATKKMYGIDRAGNRLFGAQCLLARRLAEAGVRFIEISHGGWDHHQSLRQRIAQNAQEIDRPIAALIADLKQRGMLKDTLLVWGGEFGRTTQAQFASHPCKVGRNHNNRGFSMWMAGGGVKGGLRYGSTDPLSGAAISGRIHLHDLHATILHLLGLDPGKLAYPEDREDFRPSAAHGIVVREILS
jgi:hypothetical protein